VDHFATWFRGHDKDGDRFIDTGEVDESRVLRDTGPAQSST